MTDPQHMAPLAAFHGAKPPAPAWFDAALAHEPERTVVEVEGAKVEVLAWGERGRPGLMFLHGGAAHADWWSFIAPFFADERRVVASTFTGMGRSDWRERYDFEQFVREARAAGRAAGAFDAGKPIVVGHSFGGRVTMGFSRDFGDEILGGVMVDPPFFAPQNFRPPVAAPALAPCACKAVARGGRRALPPDAAAALRAPLHPGRDRAPLGARGGRRGRRARLVALLRSALLGEVRPHRSDPDRRGVARSRWR